MTGVLAGRVAVITGAASGIGRAMALAFTAAGARAIIVADIRDEPREGGTTTVDAVRAAGGEAVFVATDVRRAADLEAALAATEAFGGLDIWVNNAGIFRWGFIADFSEDDFDATFDVNVKGTYLGCQTAMRAFLRQERGGVILNMSSVAGISGARRVTAYAASKGAVRLLTYALADEAGPHGIRVNAIHPGFVESSMTRNDLPKDIVSSTPLGRPGSPEDVARAAVWLASDEASYISGTSIVVDGAGSRVM